jgi:hypothetical protein
VVAYGGRLCDGFSCESHLLLIFWNVIRFAMTLERCSTSSRFCEQICCVFCKIKRKLDISQRMHSQCRSL